MRRNDYWICATEPGNIELLEDKPGEMLAFSFKEELEGVAVVSRWKEGAHVQKAGKRFGSQEALEADNFEHQFLFVNFPIGSTPAESSLVDASVNIDSLQPTLEPFYLLNVDTTQNSAFGLSQGMGGVVYPVLQEDSNGVRATGWQLLTFVDDPWELSQKKSLSE